MRTKKGHSDPLSTPFSGARRLYFGGICGSSMSGLARMAQARGFSVRGCDRRYRSGEAEALREAGIPVEAEDRASPARGETFVYTLALDQTSRPMVRAKMRGIPTVPRIEFLRFLMEDSPHRVTVSGMHGKSTTVGMLAHIFQGAGLDPNVSSGAPLTQGGESYRIGGGEVFLAEACEYRNAFHALRPTLALVTNIDHDHPDWFHTMADVEESFAFFLGRAKGAIVNADCPPLARIAPRGAVTYGFSRGADYHATPTRGGLLIRQRGEKLGLLTLSVGGAYQWENALGAVALSREMGIPFPCIAEQLASFRGIGRRMERVGSCRGATVYLDYAHHPTEIRAALQAARGLGKRVFCLYQPHTYTRTQTFWQAFGKSLAEADMTTLVDIYPAREQPIPDITSKRLAEEAGFSYAPTAEEALQKILPLLREGDVLLLMGAGDVAEARHLFDR